MSRRSLLASLVGAGAAASLGLPAAATRAATVTPEGALPKRVIPSSGEEIPALGMGTWITFNVGSDPDLRQQRTEVLRTFFARGGAMIDSSPMYGSSEEVVGYCLKRLDNDRALFSATKVWTPLLAVLGKGQMENSRDLWGVERFDLMQVHNLVDWETHLDTLEAYKAEGRIRYLGVTTSHGRRHEELESLMRARRLDFVQLTYNVLDREAEARLLPLAAERGQAVIVNRPFRQDGLFRHVRGHPLPDWAAEIGCANWAQLFLKFILAHPAVTCAIPATSRVDHMEENLGALSGPLPDADLRERIIRHLESL